MAWVKGRYKLDQVDPRIFITTLTPVGVIGSFNIFHMKEGNIDVTTYNDQPKLLEFINSNIGGVFGIKFLIPGTKWYEYPVPTSTGVINVLTIAGATLIMSPPKKGYKSLEVDEIGRISIK